MFATQNEVRILAKAEFYKFITQSVNNRKVQICNIILNQADNLGNTHLTRPRLTKILDQKGISSSACYATLKPLYDMGIITFKDKTIFISTRRAQKSIYKNLLQTVNHGEDPLHHLNVRSNQPSSYPRQSQIKPRSTKVTHRPTKKPARAQQAKSLESKLDSHLDDEYVPPKKILEADSKNETSVFPKLSKYYDVDPQKQGTTLANKLKGQSKKYLYKPIQSICIKNPRAGIKIVTIANANYLQGRHAIRAYRAGVVAFDSYTQHFAKQYGQKISQERAKHRSQPSYIAKQQFQQVLRYKQSHGKNFANKIFTEYLHANKLMFHQKGIKINQNLHKLGKAHRQQALKDKQ